MNAIDNALKALEYATYYLRDDVSATPIQQAHEELQKHQADTVCISRGEFGNHVASVMNYHSQSDPEFCENYRKDIDRLLDRE